MGISKRDDVVAFLSFLKEHESPECFNQWLGYALDHRTSYLFSSDLYRLGLYPSLATGWYSERERMEDWRVEQTRTAARYSK